MLKANRKTVITNVKVEFAKPMPAKQTAWRPKATERGILLSYFETNQPEIGNPINELIGMVSNTEPNSASLNPNAPLIVGILDAQLEKQNPERKKNALKKNLCFFRDSIFNIKCKDALLPVANKYSPHIYFLKWVAGLNILKELLYFDLIKLIYPGSIS